MTTNPNMKARGETAQGRSAAHAPSWKRAASWGALAVPMLVGAREARAEPTGCGVHPNAIVADLGLHVVNAGYQRTVSCWLVLQATAGLYVPWMVNDDVLGLGGGERKPDGIWDAAGFVVRARPFFFPVGTAPTGFWISPFLQAGYVRGLPPDGGESFGGYAQAAGLSVGGNIPLGSRVILGLGGGAQLHAAFFHGNTNPPGFATVGPHVDINLDVRF
ncbi:MAG: hypothetical protein U0414_30395 [Polyangiaceae bacterium]